MTPERMAARWFLVGLVCASCSSPDKPLPPASTKPSDPVASAASSASAPVSKPPPIAKCPDGMAEVTGGRFKIGSDNPGSAPEEEPAYETQIASFCLDLTEVTTSEYDRCVQAKKCSPAHDDRRFCNSRKVDVRGDHPINCVDWKQSLAMCESRGARLPTEAEWEYAARGGTENLAYSWGNEAPDGRTCWKHVGGTCKVKTFRAGAFGLYDVIGNVWEWTADWFGDYPWPPTTGQTKLYRGGSWSRRFPKWMSPKLRNRFRPSEWGSHLGLRCALTLPATKCPYGRTPDEKACLHGVESVSCKARTSWNGVRCARSGEPECPAGKKKAPGHGCILESAFTGAFVEAESGPVTRARSPEFDEDCLKNKPGRPHAYKYKGGTHQKRNQMSRGAGCSNRDVGVGWNSTCCP